jgi:hypothetical protein
VVTNKDLIDRLKCAAKWDCIDSENPEEQHISYLAAERIASLEEERRKLRQTIRTLRGRIRGMIRVSREKTDGS